MSLVLLFFVHASKGHIVVRQSFGDGTLSVLIQEQRKRPGDVWNNIAINLSSLDHPISKLTKDQ